MKFILVTGAILSFCIFLADASTRCLAGPVYSIQVAASTDKAKADATSAEMNRMGHQAFVRLESVPGKGQWHRVYVERFKSKPEADKEAAMLRSLGLLEECQVKALQEEAAPQPQRSQILPRKEAAPTRLHYLHFGSFKEKANAEKDVARLEKLGQKAFFVEEGSGENKWIRTYIGEFTNTHEAQIAGSRLKERGVISYFKVISFNGGGDLTTKHAKVTKR